MHNSPHDSPRAYTYILRCADDSLYIGMTTDLERRLLEHNTSKLGAKYTRGRRPTSLVYSESFSTKQEAQKREYALKQLSRQQKMEIIRTHKESSE